MTNPTDPRIEAAARVIQKAVGGENSAFFDFLAADALKAADEAAWRPIESAPKLKDAYIDIWTNFYGGERYTDCSFRDGHWMIWIKDGFGDGEYERVPGTVTHWRPQPEGPKP